MKGSNKEFTRYLDSELNDASLEAPDDLIRMLKDEDKKSKEKENTPSIIRKCPLTNDLIKDFTSSLGSEASQCFRDLCQIKSLQDKETLSSFKDIYAKYETVPVLFLSLEKSKKIVYVWQINRRCPVMNFQYMAVDTKSLNQSTKKHLSFLLLAKITPDENEELLSAHFINDRKLLVKSRVGYQDVMLRIYYIKNFVETARVNPCKEEVLANDLYSFRIQLRGYNTKNLPLDVTLFRRKTPEEMTLGKDENTSNEKSEEQKATENCIQSKDAEIFLETVACQLSKPFPRDVAISELLPASKDGLLLIDYSLSIMIGWEGNKIFVCSSSPGTGITRTFIKGDRYYVIDSSEQIYDLNLKEFPLIGFESIKTYVLPKDYYLSKYYSKTPHMLILSQDSATVLWIDFKSMEILGVKDPQKPQGLDTMYKFTGRGYISIKHDIVLNICDGKLMVYKMTEYGYTETFLFKLPMPKEACTDRNWVIIGSGERFFLYDRSYTQYLNTIIIEFKLKADCIPKSELQVVSKTNLFSNNYELFGQVEGPQEDIVFIRFDDEPFYLDKANLMYDEPVSLVNPHAHDNPDHLVKEEEKDEIFTKRMNQFKNKITHPKDTQTSLEEKRDTLKQVRATISSKLTEIKKFHQNDPNKPKRKANSEERISKEPKISKDLLNLFDDIKKEKRRIKKLNEKKKDKNKKEKGRYEDLD